MLGMCPCFPYRNQLYNDAYSRCGMFGQGNKSFHQGPCFGMGCDSCTSDGSQPLKLAHAEAVNAKPKHPNLITCIIAGWGGIEREGPSLILMRGKWCQLTPGPMALVRVSDVLMLLWFQG